MPRTIFCGSEKKNKVKDLPKFIVSKLYENDMTRQDYAESIGITKQSLSYRLKQEKEKGSDLFTYGDLLTLFRETNATDEEILKVMKL